MCLKELTNEERRDMIKLLPLNEVFSEEDLEEIFKNED